MTVSLLTLGSTAGVGVSSARAKCQRYTERELLEGADREREQKRDNGLISEILFPDVSLMDP